MKNKLFYIFLFLFLINIFVNRLVNFINLVNAGIFLALIAGKQKTGSYSLWKLIIGITIVSISLLIVFARIFNLLKL